jgi:hypothetical protein
MVFIASDDIQQNASLQAGAMRDTSVFKPNQPMMDV